MMLEGRNSAEERLTPDMGKNLRIKDDRNTGRPEGGSGCHVLSPQRSAVAANRLPSPTPPEPFC